MNYFYEFKKGAWLKNPVLVITLGLCPALAVATSVVNALWMSLAVTFVLVISNILVSLVKNYIPEHIRLPVFVTIIAALVTIVELTFNSLESYNKALGIYLPLIAVNFIILGRAEEFASKNDVVSSALDGLIFGAGFSITLIVLASIREIMGANTFFGYPLLDNVQPVSVMILAPGAFFILGLMLWGVNTVIPKK